MQIDGRNPPRKDEKVDGRLRRVEPKEETVRSECLSETPALESPEFPDFSKQPDSTADSDSTACRSRDRRIEV